MDGSFHEWYEQRGPKNCLTNLVDDATPTTLAMMGAEDECERGDGAAVIARRGIQDALRADV